MPIEFFDDNPRRQFGPELRRLFAGAQRIDAAIAFVTAHGARMLADFLTANPAVPCRLVVSVRYPTDLAAVQRLGSLSTDPAYPASVEAVTGKLRQQIPAELGSPPTLCRWKQRLAS